MIKPKHRGARNELAAICWLLEQGYDVYRNVSQHGIIDVIAIKDGETLFLDVKSAFALRASEEQISNNVKWLVCAGNEFTIVNPEPKGTSVLCKSCGKTIPTTGMRRSWCSQGCKNDAEKRMYREQKNGDVRQYRRQK
jgi:hypothetical protein